MASQLHVPPHGPHAHAAGILALPAVTAEAGFPASLAALAGCCLFSIATGARCCCGSARATQCWLLHGQLAIPHIFDADGCMSVPGARAQQVLAAESYAAQILRYLYALQRAWCGWVCCESLLLLAGKHIQLRSSPTSR